VVLLLRIVVIVVVDIDDDKLLVYALRWRCARKRASRSRIC
jgi:hypothetical protein